MRTGLRCCCVLLVAGMLSACGADEPRNNGVLVVPFKLGNGRDCSDLGVVAVRGELDDGAYQQEVDCEAGEVRFTLLPPGRFDVLMYGLDDEGVAVMDSLGTEPGSIDVVDAPTPPM